MIAMLTDINRQHTTELRKDAARRRLARRAAMNDAGTGTDEAVKQVGAPLTRRAHA
jgi:hypothetical protein